MSVAPRMCFVVLRLEHGPAPAENTAKSGTIVWERAIDGENELGATVDRLICRVHAPLRNLRLVRSTSVTSFIAPQSIVRRIWGDPNVVLLIFAGGAAEFALNKAVDWLFFTDRLPKDPIGRLFSTVRYAQQIVFAAEHEAHATFARINAIHAGVEHARGDRIPDWAHRDVLYMLIDYSQRAYELFHRPLTSLEQDDLFESFLRVGRGLQVQALPSRYSEWKADRQRHLERDLEYGEYTRRLFERYRDQLGFWRYRLLLELQALLVPDRVRELLRLTSKPLLIEPCVGAYSFIARLGLQEPVQRVLIPRAYWPQIASLAPR